MDKRVKIDELEKTKQEEKPDPTLPGDMRNVVPPGDPKKETVTHSQTEMRQVEITTPTARVVFRGNAVFPFDLFPDQVIIDEIKVTIIENRFFATQGVNHILIKDIKSVEINSVPFFAELAVVAQNGTYKIDFLSKDKANKAKRIILGLLIMSERAVDTSKMEIPELIARTEELGTGRK